MEEERVVRMKRTLRADRERVFDLLTDGLRLREWFCDMAWTQPWPGGRYALFWRYGLEVQGTFVEVEQPEEVLLVWQGSGDPGPTLVKWELEEGKEGCEVEVEHRGFGRDPRWDAALAEAEKRWAAALENLQSILEEGVDLREARRPLLGVSLEGLDAGRARREGIAAEMGLYVANVVPGGAAEAAGIRRGDVIVALGGYETMDYGRLLAAMQAFRAGDTVAVEVVRGQERLTFQATLKERPVPPVPDEPMEAAKTLRERYAQLGAALAGATAGLSEEEAGRRPAPGEWSVKEVLAHLSVCERSMHEYWAGIASGLVTEGEANPTVWPDRLSAILAVEPTLSGLLSRLARDMEETVRLIEHLSAETRADRYRYRRIVRSALEYPEHIEDHLGQIRRTAEVVHAQAGG